MMYLRELVVRDNQKAGKQSVRHNRFSKAMSDLFIHQDSFFQIHCSTPINVHVIDYILIAKAGKQGAVVMQSIVNQDFAHS